MTTKYTLYFTDTNKSPFDLQSYTKNGPESPSDPSIITGASTASTTLKLYGKGNNEYGEPIFQDLIYMLENFANDSRPVFSIEGQLWYNNNSISPELFLRNDAIDDDFVGSPAIHPGWDAVILATGTSAMTAELILSGTPSNTAAAVPKQYVDDHFVDVTLHITSNQNTFLDALSLPTLTASEVNQLIGISSNVQSQLNDKVSLSTNNTMSTGINLTFFGGGEVLGLPATPSATAATSKEYVDDNFVNIVGGIMASNADITFSGGGEVLGLPDVPSNNNAAASKKYVDDQLVGAPVGDGVLTSTQWVNTGIGSPAPVITENTLELIVTLPNLSTTTIQAEGIARVGHTHSTLDDHLADSSLHITSDQNTFLNALSLPTLTASEVNQLIGISSNVQSQLNDKVSLSTNNTMSGGINLTFSGGGEVLGLPATPSATGATSKEYVDTNKANILNPIFTDTVQILGNLDGTTATFSGGVSGVDPIADLEFTTKQYVDTLVGAATPIVGFVPPRLFEILSADFTSPTPYVVQSHIAGDNTLSITVNGVKQYLGTRGVQSILYDTNIISINATKPTGLDQSLDYDFAINVDGAGATTITILSGTDTSTHGALRTAINIQLGGSPPAAAIDFDIVDTGTEAFTAFSQATGSSVVVTDPVTANTYLFEVDASPNTIVAATFLSEPQYVLGSPPGSPIANPDTIEISGDVTATFPIGTNFAIRGSVEATYGSYDGMYSVHNSGAVYAGSPNVTIIPIALFDSPAINTPLLPFYQPIGSPLPPPPAPSLFGATHISPIIGIDQVATPASGLEGDYIETDASGNTLPQNTITSHVVFNYDILSGSKIESLSFT